MAEKKPIAVETITTMEIFRRFFMDIIKLHQEQDCHKATKNEAWQ